MVLHLGNALLIAVTARRIGLGWAGAWLAAVVFGVHPLSSTLLSSAVGVNDQAALLFALLALHASRRGRRGRAASAGLFALAMLCKESVLCLAALGLIIEREKPWQARVRDAIPMAGVAGGFAVVFFALRPLGLAPDANVYGMAPGANVVHNYMTYIAWAVNIGRALPDLTSSYDVTAWRVGVPVTAAALLLWAMTRRTTPVVGAGLVWWILGLLPVLPLERHTYRHCLYPALPGLAIVSAGALGWAGYGLKRALQRGAAQLQLTHAARDKWAAVGMLVVAATALAYSAIARDLVRERYAARVYGTTLALDPVARRREVARNAIESLRHALTTSDTCVVVLLPEGVGRVMGARSGRAVEGSEAGRAAYDLLTESIEHGRAIRLFYPWVDSVACINRWTSQYRGYTVLIPLDNGHLMAVSRGPMGLEEVGVRMLELQWNAQAVDLFAEAVNAYPMHRELRLGYALALARVGAREQARGQLEDVVRASDADRTGAAARRMLQVMRE
jgi:hypothetical protein